MQRAASLPGEQQIQQPVALHPNQERSRPSMQCNTQSTSSSHHTPPPLSLSLHVAFPSSPLRRTQSQSHSKVARRRRCSLKKKRAQNSRQRCRRQTVKVCVKLCVCVCICVSVLAVCKSLCAYMTPSSQVLVEFSL